MAIEYPGALDVWGGGQLLAFSGVDGPTPFRDALAGRTAMQGAGITLKIPGEAQLCFNTAAPEKCFVTSDVVDVHHEGGRTRAVLTDACHLLVEGPCDVRSCGAELAVVEKESRTLIGAASVFDEARINDDIDAAIEQRLQWILAAAKPGFASEQSARTYWKALSIMKGFTYAPEGVLKHRYVTPDRWPHRGTWLWDSAFQAIGLRHVDAATAWDAVSAVLDAQREDGFVAIDVQRCATLEETQPPTLAMAARLVHQASPDPGRLAELFPKLGAYLEWDMRNRDTDGTGLVEWKIGGGERCQCGESGWDNTPVGSRASPAVG